MARFFPDARRIALAREHFALASYGEVQRALDTRELKWPYTDDLPRVVAEFGSLANEFGLLDHDASFIVLVSVRANGSRLTTPLLIDVERQQLAFTSHPAFGAETVSAAVLAENSGLAAEVREGLLGVLATWQNRSAEAQ